LTEIVIEGEAEMVKEMRRDGDGEGDEERRRW
jgi:hypothetical protein